MIDWKYTAAVDHGKDGESAKFDDGKLRWSLLCIDAIESIARVREYGVQKYGAPENWRTVHGARRRYFDAAMRHFFAWWRGSSLDTESGLPHLAHAMCNLMFILQLEMEKK